MILFRTLVSGIVLCSILEATSLKEIVNATLKNNDTITLAKLQKDLAHQEYRGVGNTFNPIVSLGANYTKLDADVRETQVGTTTTAFAKMSINLYDGGKLQATKGIKKYVKEALAFSVDSKSKNILLQVVTLYFQTKNMIDEIEVFQKKSQTLLAQYERVKTKFHLQMTTEDEVLKLKSEYETNQYFIEQLKYQKYELLSNLSLLSGLEINNIEDVTLPNVAPLKYQKSENIYALELLTQAAKMNEKALDSIKMPKVILEDRINYYNYSDYNKKILKDLPEVQNNFSLSLSYTLYDTTSNAKIEASKISTLLSNSEAVLAKKQEKVNFLLAKAKLETQKMKISSLKAALEMGESLYKIVKQKYQNGIVDNIAYLDALSKKIYNEALYKEALNEYEIAKASYYLASGMSYKTIIESWR